MKVKLLTGIVLLMILSTNMSFAKSETATGADSIPAMSKTVVVKQQLEVIGINHEKRWVQLKDTSGFVQKINVGEEARNFGQMVVGDIVTINRSNTIKIKAFSADITGTDVDSKAAAIFARTPEGQKPGAAIVGAEVVVVTIAAIDLENSLVTLEDKEGNLNVLRPQVPANLKKVKVGDKVAIMLIQTFSISVEKAK